MSERGERVYENTVEIIAHGHLANVDGCPLCGKGYVEYGATVMVRDSRGRFLTVMCPVCLAAGPRILWDHANEYIARLRARADDLLAEAHQVEGLVSLLNDSTRWADAAELLEAQQRFRPLLIDLEESSGVEAGEVPF